MKASVDVADLIGLNLVMSRNAGKGEYKIMVAALGWATAELIMSRCVQQPGAQTPEKGHLGSRGCWRRGGSLRFWVQRVSGYWRIPPFAFLSCIPLWVGARGIEFDWKYIQMSIDSNISLVRSPAYSTHTSFAGGSTPLEAQP